MSYRDDIQNYGEAIDDFDTSPFEAVDALHLRDRLERNLDRMDRMERQELLNYDLKLLMNAPKMYEHLRSVHDFSCKQPSDGWWWRLDEMVKINEVLRNAKKDTKGFAI